MARDASARGLIRLGTVNVFFATEDAADFAPGAVVIPRRNAKPNVYPTIYHALRSRIEIMRRYGLRKGRGEMQELERLRSSARDMRVDLAAGGSSDVAAAIEAMAASLGRKSNPFKASARGKAKAGVVRYPDGANVNRPATAARVTAIDRRLEAREEEVRTIAPWVGAVESALLLETRRSLDVVADVERAVNAVMRHRLLTAGSASDAQCVALAARLRIADEDLGTLRTAPFLGLRGTLREPMLGAILAAQSGTAGTLRDQVAVVRAAVGRQSARARIEAALTMVAGASSPSAVQKAIDAANRALVAMPKPDDAAVRAADLAVAGLKMAVRALKEGTIEAAKPWLREAIVPLS